MAGILVYALHFEGAFNKNSLGAVSEGARLAKELGTECHAIVVGGEDLTDELCSSLGSYGATRVFRARGPEGLGEDPLEVEAAAALDDVARQGEGRRSEHVQRSVKRLLRSRDPHLVAVDVDPCRVEPADGRHQPRLAAEGVLADVGVGRAFDRVDDGAQRRNRIEGLLPSLVIVGQFAENRKEALAAAVKRARFASSRVDVVYQHSCNASRKIECRALTDPRTCSHTPACLLVRCRCPFVVGCS